MPEQPKEAEPMQENVRYWVVVDEDGLACRGTLSLSRHPMPAEESTMRLIRVTLQEVFDD